MPRTGSRLILAVTAALLGLTGCATTAPLPVESSPVAPSPSPTPEPSVTAEPAVNCETPLPAPPAGGIALSDLCGATIDVPAWTNTACPAGPQTFVDGVVSIGPSFFLNVGSSALVSDRGIAYTDIDGDGQSETVLLLSCGGEGWSSQVIVLRRVGDGTIQTLGAVTRTEGEVKRLLAVEAGAAGAVRVEVADYNPGLGGDASISQRQWREYAFTGAAFAQSGGPTSFPANQHLVDLAVTATPLEFGPVQLAQRTGTFSVTVRNPGDWPVPYSVLADLPAGVRLVPTADCAVGESADPVKVTCSNDRLAAHASRTHRLTFTVPADFDPSGSPYIHSVYLQVGAGYADTDASDNEAPIEVTLP